MRVLLIEDSTRLQNAAGRALRKSEAEIVVYAIGLLNQEDPTKAERAREALDELTAATGGRAYYPAAREQADAAVREIGNQMRHLYTIGYSPLEQALDGSYRKLRVVAKSPEKLFVTTRAGYRATRALAGDK